MQDQELGRTFFLKDVNLKVLDHIQRSFSTFSRWLFVVFIHKLFIELIFLLSTAV